MKKIIKIISSLTVVFALAIMAQSFMAPEPPPEAPTQTVVHLYDADGYYAVKVGIQGYLYTDPLWWKITYMEATNPDDPEYLYTGEKYEYNTTYPGSCGVWTKDISTSNWEFQGNIDHDDEDCTITHNGSWLYGVSFSINDLVDPN